MMSRAWMEVDLGALVRNASALCEHAGVPIIPMIKADAYGLGAVEVARALESLDPLAYGLATVLEGEELRAAGIIRPILIFTPLLVEEMDAANAARLTPTLGSLEEIRAWTCESPYHLSIDTGMARAGIPWREVITLRDVIAEKPPEGAFTHFHSPSLDDGSMDAQLARFREALATLPSPPDIIHTDSSAAIVRHGRSPWNAVRPGIFMYGVGSGRAAALEPECVVHVKTRIVEVRRVEAGDTVSYDATWEAPEARVVATVPMGYADGYPRGASGRGSVLVNGRTVPILGRVTMDMIMIDVTDTGAKVGDVVTLIGDSALISVADVADAADLSPYELLTGLRGRLPRTYHGH